MEKEAGRSVPVLRYVSEVHVYSCLLLSQLPNVVSMTCSLHRKFP
jgi:hypothetical protein